LLQRTAQHQPVAVKQLATSLPAHRFKKSVGGKAQTANCDRGSPPFASAPRIAIMRKPNLTRNNGY
jgi:hypothetical protein